MPNEPHTIDMTPVGMQTPEGAQRVTKALDAWQSAQAEAANGALFFLRDHAAPLAETARRYRADDNAFAYDLGLLDEKLRDMKTKQEDFLRAVAGR